MPDDVDNPVHHMSKEEAETFKQSHPTEPEPPSIYALPSPIEITQTNKYSEKRDPPLVAISVTNPVTYLKLFLNKLLKNEGIDIRLKIKPLTAIFMGLGLAASFGTGYGSGLHSAAGILFPRSSPILHRAVIYQGIIQKTDSGQYLLTLPDNSSWTLKPTSQIPISILSNSVNREVLVRGNLTKEQDEVEVREVNTFTSNP